MVRYSVIEEKNPREIVLLRGRGCVWKRCTFCDYHLDQSQDEAANLALNRSVMDQVTGKYGELEIINSGSFVDLEDSSMEMIRSICHERGINVVHFECHYIHRDAIPALRSFFGAAGIQLKLKIGVESFDYKFREEVLDKGIPTDDPADIALGFEECNLMAGISGQTVESMKRDIEIGLAHFERICVNVMTENTTKIQPDPAVISDFREHILPMIKDDPRVDYLMENTDFGVGSPEEE